MATQDKSLSERLQQRSEARRRIALASLPAELMPASLEKSQVPVILYKDYGIAYVNPAGITKLEYTFDELKTFNNITLDTGESKKKLDEILVECAKREWADLDLSIYMRTLDNKGLFMAPHMRHTKVAGHDYWVSRIIEAEKVDLQWIKRQQTVFRKNWAYASTDENVTKNILEQAVRAMADGKYNFVLDFSRASKFEPGAIPILTHLTETSMKDQLFLVNTSEPLYRMLAHRKFPHYFPARKLPA